MPVYRNCCSTKLSSKSISFCKTSAENSQWEPEEPSCCHSTADFSPHFGYLPPAHSDSEQAEIEIPRLMPWISAGSSALGQPHLLCIGADAADEEWLSSAQCLQQLVKWSLKWNSHKSFSSGISILTGVWQLLPQESGCFRSWLYKTQTDPPTLLSTSLYLVLAFLKRI